MAWQDSLKIFQKYPELTSKILVHVAVETPRGGSHRSTVRLARDLRKMGVHMRERNLRDEIGVIKAGIVSNNPKAQERSVGYYRRVVEPIMKREGVSEREAWRRVSVKKERLTVLRAQREMADGEVYQDPDYDHDEEGNLVKEVGS